MTGLLFAGGAGFGLAGLRTRIPKEQRPRPSPLLGKYPRWGKLSYTTYTGSTVLPPPTIMKNHLESSPKKETLYAGGFLPATHKTRM